MLIVSNIEKYFLTFVFAMKIQNLFIVSILLLLAFPLGLSAQRQVVKGRVVLYDASRKAEPLPYANISLMQLPDSAFTQGTVSDEQGRFTLVFSRKKSAGYQVKISYTGCTSVYKSLSSNADTIRLGTITLKDDPLHLKEIVVTAPLKPMEQKGDTTIYNAGAYPTPEGAYLEELVKRIPGLTYDSKDQTITYNGHTIKEITVNGKDFFKGNQQIVLENLPAKFISQLKVYDKPTKEEEATGIKSTEKNYVLDLQTKEEVNNALLLSAEAGYGTHKRRDINGKIMRFNEKGDNFMVNGQSTNRYATTLYEGNISNTVGASITKVKDKIEFSGNIGYSNDRNGSESSSYSEQYLTTANQYAISESSSRSKGNRINGNMDATWKIDDQTTFNISGSVNSNFNKSNNQNREATFDTNPEVDTQHPFERFEQTDPATRINNSNSQSQTNSRNTNYNFSTSLIRKLNKKGNNISFNFSTYQQTDNTEYYTLSSTDYYRLQDLAGKDSVLYRNQYQHTPGKEQNYTLNLAYTQVLTDKSRLQFTYGLTHNKEKLNGNTYDLSPLSSPDTPPGILPEGYESYNIDSLTSRSNSRTTGHNLSTVYSYNGEIWGVRSALTATFQKRTIEESTGSRMADTIINSLEWKPSFTITYRKDDNYGMISYNGSTSRPALRDLIAPTDYSSPLNVTRSNPNLHASYTHYIYAMFSNFRKGIMVGLNWNQQINAVTRATIYHTETGGRETFPVNINGNWNLSGNASYDKRINQFRLYIMGSGNFNQNVSLINEGYETDQPQRSNTHTTGLNSDLRLSYLPSWGNIDLNGKWTFYQSKNSLQDRNTYTRVYTLGLESSVNLPADFIFQTDANYRFRNGTGISGNDENEILWNIKLSWKFLKEKRAELSLYWADILNQRKSLSRSASSTGFYEYYEQQLRGYVMVSLKYELNSMN